MEGVNWDFTSYGEFLPRRLPWIHLENDSSVLYVPKLIMAWI